MAKFHIAALLLCLFTVSLARTTPEDNDATTTQVALPFPSADLAYAEMDPNSAVPFPEITFRPVNRRFNQRTKLPCRHHFKFYPNEEISYGNDMILSSGENSDFEQPIVRGQGNRIRGRWVRMHHRHEDSDSDSDSDDEGEDRVKKVVFRHYDDEKKLKHFRVRNEAEKKKKGGFMRRVRKFLDNYF